MFRDGVIFPEAYSKGATGGDGFKTRVLTNEGGYEDRNMRWEKTRGVFDVSHLLKDRDQTIELQRFWLAIGQGRAYGFLFKYWGDFCADMRDWTIATQISASTVLPSYVNELPLIGVGDSTNGTDGTGTFQLIKDYTFQAYNYQRTVLKPKVGTTRIFLDGVEDTNFTVDETTGLVTFTPGSHPLTGVEIRAWYEYFYPVRFDSDLNEIILEPEQTFDMTSWPTINLVELKDAT